MKRIIFLCTILFVLFVIIYIGSQINYRQRQQEDVKSGLESLVKEISLLEEDKRLDIIYQEFSDKEYGITCYYARAYIIVGSSLSEAKALDHQKKRLLAQGWILKTEYETAIVLIRGQNDRLVVETVPPNIIEKNDYDQLKNKYHGVIFIRMDYMLPSRDEC